MIGTGNRKRQDLPRCKEVSGVSCVFLVTGKGAAKVVLFGEPLKPDWVSGIRGQGSELVILRVAKRKQAKSQNPAPFMKGGGYEVAGGLQLSPFHPKSIRFLGDYNRQKGPLFAAECRFLLFAEQRQQGQSVVFVLVSYGQRQ
jgi:hypothetical protein